MTDTTEEINKLFYTIYESLINNKKAKEQLQKYADLTLKREEEATLAERGRILKIIKKSFDEIIEIYPQADKNDGKLHTSALWEFKDILIEAISNPDKEQEEGA